MSPEIRSAVILIDGKPATTLTSPLWKAVIDLGPEMVPHEMVAVGYDDAGLEIARESQTVNLPRPEAELSLTLVRKDQSNVAAELRWQHISAERPFRIEMTLDGKRVRVDRNGRALLRVRDDGSIHALKAEVEFRDRAVARREVVFGGQFSYEMPAELTPVLVRDRNRGTSLPESCFLVEGHPVRATAIEQSTPLVLFVRSGNPSVALSQLHSTVFPSAPLRPGRFRLDGSAQFLWPTPRKVPLGEKSIAVLFDRSPELSGEQGVLRLLVRIAGTPPHEIRFADAVAVAGVHAAKSGRRRVVVMVLGADGPDVSDHDPRAVRRYLQAIGVPLMVWSLKGPRPELETQWGDITDVSTLDKLSTATAALNRELEGQRIAWLAAGPFAALKARSTPECRFEPEAR